MPVWLVTHAQEADSIYIEQTGHSIRGPFYEEYQRATNPDLIYGFPITGQIKSRDGQVVQYFQKARFELTPQGTVQITPLGKIFHDLEQPGFGTGQPANPGCQRFPETGTQVCYEFLDFFETHGGVAQFGKPLTNYLFLKNQRVGQYFENALFEYYPERPAGQKIALAWLGEDYFNTLQEDPSHREAEPWGFIADGVVELDVQAFIARDVAAKDYAPTLYVIVRDQRRIKLKDSSVEFVVRYSDGQEERYIMDPTNKFGFTKMKFPVKESEPGIVEVSVKATYLDQEEETRTSFRIWY